VPNDRYSLTTYLIVVYIEFFY